LKFSLKNNFNAKKIKRHLEYLDEKIDKINEALGHEEINNEPKKTLLIER